MPKVNKIIQRLINQERIQLNENTEIKPLISTSPPLSPPPPPPSSTRNSQVQRQKPVISRQQPYVSEPSRVSLNPLIKHDSNVQLFSSSSASSLKGNNDHDELFPFINFNEFEFSHRGTILNSRTRSSRRNHLRDTNIIIITINNIIGFIINNIHFQLHIIKINNQIQIIIVQLQVR